MTETSTLKKKQAPRKKKAVVKKEKVKAVGFLNPQYTTNSGKVVKLKGIAIFDNKETYDDPKAIHLVEVAKRNGNEITIPMMVTIRVNHIDEEIIPDEDIPFGI